MSHMAKVTTKCTDLDILKDVLKDMGFTVENNSGTVRAMDGKTAKVVATVKGQEFGIQATKEKNGETTYNLAGEFFRSGWYLKEKAMGENINREYAFKKTVKEAEAKGFRMKPGSLKLNKDGSKVFVMQKM